MIESAIPVGRRLSEDQRLIANLTGSLQAVTFTLVTPTRHYRFMADTESLKDEWKLALVNIIESLVES